MLVIFLGLSVIVFLLVFYATRKQLFVFIKHNFREKTGIGIFVAEIIISIIGFFLMYISTFPPQMAGGNGNPFLLLFPIVVGIFLHSCVILSLLVYQRWRPVTNIAFYLSSLIILVVIVGCGLFEYKFAISLFRELGSFKDPNSVIYRSTILNVHTNSIFFNLYTFIGFYGISILASIILRHFKYRE